MPSPAHTPAADLHSGGHKEVLLLEAQLLALVRAVIGVQHRGQRLGALLGQNGLQQEGWVGSSGCLALAARPATRCDEPAFVKLTGGTNFGPYH